MSNSFDASSVSAALAGTPFAGRLQHLATVDSTNLAGPRGSAGRRSARQRMGRRRADRRTRTRRSRMALHCRRWPLRQRAPPPTDCTRRRALALARDWPRRTVSHRNRYRPQARHSLAQRSSDRRKKVRRNSGRNLHASLTVRHTRDTALRRHRRRHQRKPSKLPRRT